MLNRKQHTSRSRLSLTLLAIATAALLQSITATPSVLAAESCPNQTVREQQRAAYLPNCRGYEQVSPAQKNDNEVSVPGQFKKSVPFEAAAKGSGIAYTGTGGGFPGSLGAGLFTPYLSSSSSLGSPWQTRSLGSESRFSELDGTELEFITEFGYLSPELTCGVESSVVPLAMHPGEEQPDLPPGESVEEQLENLYVWNAADDSHTLVTNLKPENAGVVGQYGGEYDVDGASSDCSHVIFESAFQFLGAPASKSLSSLYEWDQGTLRVASVLPDGTLPPAGVKRTEAGARGSDLNEISSDGSRVFFTAKADKAPDSGKEEVFMRLDGTSTVEVSASETGVADAGAKFQAASASGEQVFFTANYGLAASSTSAGAASCDLETGAGCDLYDYNTVTGTLSDISADTHASETGDTTGADVRGVLGVSEEGEVVYFSASGRLVPGKGKTQTEDEAGKEANVYAYSNGQLAYVASIGDIEAGAGAAATSEEEVDAIAAAGLKGFASYTASRVSSDGEYLLFATRKRLTAYDNTDQGSGEADFEDYEYRLSSGSLTCVSCDPDGARPQLRLDTDTPPKAEPSFGVYGQFAEVNDGYMLRNLASDGEVYFQTSNPVVPQAINDTANVYEFQPEGVGTCPAGEPQGCVSILDSGTNGDPTYFEGASANGENVYLSTDAQLAPEDEDELRDVYDVRVDGGSLYSPPPPECEGEKCQGPLPEQEGTQTPASTLGGGNGNVSGTTVISTAPATLAIVSKKASGSTVNLKLKVSTAGKVTVSGDDVSKAVKSPKGASTLTLKVKLTKAAAAKLAKRKRVKARLTIVFKPKSGKKLTKKAKVSFRPKPKAKGKR